MNLTLTNRAQLEKVPGGHWIVNTLNKLLIAITNGYQAQHNTDDTHGAVTATSVLSAVFGTTTGGPGTFTQATVYAAPTAVRWLFGDGTNWMAVWARWNSTAAATARNPRTSSFTDVMTLSDQGVLAPVSVSGPSGVLGVTTTAPAAGGGAGATLATIGGSGPSTAAQAGWVKVTLNGTTAYLPYWT